MAIGLISELEAVNRILAASGDSPVVSLETTYLQANLAQQELAEQSRSLQAKGMWFNEENEVTLEPDAINSFITLPVNCIECFQVNVGSSTEYVQRGIKVYNRTDRTYVITEDIKFDLVLNLDWDEIPQTAREVATLRASIVFIQNFVGDNTLIEGLERQLQSAEIRLSNADTQSRRVNMLNNPTGLTIGFTNRR